MPSYNCDCDAGPSYRTLAQIRTAVLDTLGLADPFSSATTRTLAELREDMLVALGFSAQLASPPPGVNDLMDRWLNHAQQTIWSRIESDQSGSRPAIMSADADTTTLDYHPILNYAIALGKSHFGTAGDPRPYFEAYEKYMADLTARRPPNILGMVDRHIIAAQEYLYRKFDTFRTSRIYTWPLVAGERFYDFPDNEEVCTKRMDAGKVEWVGLSLDNGTRWVPLRSGIDPSLYDDAEPNGIPYLYEIRQCIELWPPPDATSYTDLRVKGHFGLMAFADDADVATIDDLAIEYLAVANLKAHFRQPDAQRYDTLWRSRVSHLVAESHQNRRYIPGEPDYRPPPRPVMTEYQS